MLGDPGTWLPGYLVTWLPENLVTWLPWYLVTWMLGGPGTWLPNDPRFKVMVTLILDDP
jgi:hypothetical protein